MAQGKLSPRQKMINLMYLVFIAMLALNISKEVLSAFGLMNERLTEANKTATERNAAYMAGLAEKVDEQPDRYKPLKEKADRVSEISTELDAYIQEIKDGMLGTLKESDRDNYEIMTKDDYLNQMFFQGDKRSEGGQAFVDKVDGFRSEIIEIAESENYTEIASDVKRKFDTDKVKRKNDNQEVDWLFYHYEGFPMVASLTKLTQIQSDIKDVNYQLLSKMMEGELTRAVSITNYTTLLETERSAYFQGDEFNGAIVLGRKDATTRPNEVELYLDGRELSESEYSIQDGRVVLNVGAGNAGDHQITGKLIFREEGTEEEIEVEQSFTTISRPTSATISADKMNVVYRGVKNPMTITMAGVSDGNISANAPGLTKASGAGKYVMDVSTVKAREVTINVTGKIDDKSYPSSATFRIKNIPPPVGTVVNQDGMVKLPRRNLEIATIGAALPDFDFDVTLNVTEFKIKVPGQPTQVVKGSRLNDAAKNALRRARRGETIQVFDIKARLQGSNIHLPKISPVIVELAD